MGAAMTVYSSHQNWYTQAQDLNTRLKETEARLRQAQDGADRLESTLTGERDAAQQLVSKLEAQRATLVDANAQLQAQRDQLRQRSRDQVAAVAATQQNNDRLSAEVATLRTIVRDNQLARDRGYTEMLTATESRDQTAGELEILREQNRELTQDVARMQKLLRGNGIDATVDPDHVMEPADGLVAAVRRQGSSHLIEVTIGADDGLQNGHTVEVYRGGKYLGRAEIIHTAPDRAIGKLDRRFLQGQVQEGDRVATRLKLS
jgi:hypothetical protein